MYSHRSNLLHALTAAMPDALALGSSSTMLMVVPQFHANSWGIAFAGGCHVCCVAYVGV